MAEEDEKRVSILLPKKPTELKNGVLIKVLTPMLSDNQGHGHLLPSNTPTFEATCGITASKGLWF